MSVCAHYISQVIGKAGLKSVKSMTDAYCRFFCRRNDLVSFVVCARRKKTQNKLYTSDLQVIDLHIIMIGT